MLTDVGFVAVSGAVADDAPRRSPPSIGHEDISDNLSLKTTGPLI